MASGGRRAQPSSTKDEPLEPLTIGSLCTGYGGLDLAVETVLWSKTAWYSDIDKTAQRIFEHNRPGIPNLGDVKEADWLDVRRVDILTAGYPCQPFSVAGKRRGVEDERHIWPYIAEAIRTLRPGLVVLENVRGHLSKGFDEVLGNLAQSRYRAGWLCVRASDIGAPHKRERIIIVASDTESERLYERHLRSRVQTGYADDGLDPASPADWGRFAPAITRWGRILGRPAPYPLSVGPRGGRRTSAAFGEWVMGLQKDGSPVYLASPHGR